MNIRIKPRQMMTQSYNLELSYRIMSMAMKTKKKQGKKDPGTAK